MGVRRQAREAALQMLYLCDICDFSQEDALNGYFESLLLQSVSQDFARKLFQGICAKRPLLDEYISKYAENWEMDRMAVVDRNILRLATYEIVDTPETPISVVIDEAVEIAKKYSTSDSGKFVNGILDKMKTIRQPAPGAPGNAC